MPIIAGSFDFGHMFAFCLVLYYIECQNVGVGCFFRSNSRNHCWVFCLYVKWQIFLALFVCVHRCYVWQFFRGWDLHDFVGCCMIIVLAMVLVKLSIICMVIKWSLFSDHGISFTFVGMS